MMEDTLVGPGRGVVVFVGGEEVCRDENELEAGNRMGAGE
jgi:hypothetical protein